MKYQDFIQIIGRYQTDRIKAINIPESSCPANIPLSFQSLFPDIINIIEQNFLELSLGRSSIQVFGLQVTGFAVKSDLPIKKDRIFLENQIHTHLTCALYYLSTDQTTKEPDWKNYQSVVIDFTDGTVMNNQQYLCMMACDIAGGKILGYLNKRKLALAWGYQ